MFQQENLEKMREGVELYNQQKYWECHEALEEVWLEDRQDPVRNVYWAVIQVAAACIHYREKNLLGCQGMIIKAKEKFRRCREMNLLTEVAFKYLDWEQFESIVMKIPDRPQLEDFREIFDFRFNHFPTSNR